MSTTIDDYNNDGFIDIYVTNGGDTALLINNGDETFSNQSIYTGCEQVGSTWGAAFLDTNLYTDLDLYGNSSLYNAPSVSTSVFYEQLSGNLFQIPNNTGFIGDENKVTVMLSAI